MRTIVRVLAAMGQNMRFDTLQRLSRYADLGRSAGELSRDAGIPLNNMSSHLGILRDAGLVKAQRLGRHRLYRLDASSIERVISCLQALLPASQERALKNAGATASGTNFDSNSPDHVRTQLQTAGSLPGSRRWLIHNPPQADRNIACLACIPALANSGRNPGAYLRHYSPILQ